jgi:hypothetical protein
MSHFSFRHLATVVVLAGLLAVPAGAQAPRPDGERSVFDLSFGGGSAVGYIDSIRQAAGPVNIVVEPGAELVDVPPIELKRVSLSQALALLDGASIERDNYAIRLDVATLGDAESRPVFKIQVRGQRPGQLTQRMNQVWSLQPVLAGGYEPAEVLTAIETALSMLEDTHVPADLRYHDDTSLLIVRGHPTQLATIDALHGELSANPARQERRDDQLEALRRAEMEMQHLREEANVGRREADEQARRATEWETRAVLFREELDALRMQYEQRMAELRAQLDEREAIIRQLEHHVAELEGRLQQRRES